ncbi:MAG: inositol monophosphatase [SAR324 cluster bacterium]|nr:inositol monophosphatase [SAR324 cluster bacterium]
MNDLIVKKDFLLKLIVSAGNMAKDFFYDRDSLKIDKKDHQDFVTKADKEVEIFITNQILSRFPQDEVFGEESQVSPTQEKNIWVVDPIDGTLPFLVGLPNWCVSIALVRNGTPVLGAVFDPNLNELFWGLTGLGSFLNETKITINKKTSLDFGMVGCGHSARSSQTDYLAVVAKILDKGGMIYKSGSGALMICYAATNRLTAYFEMHMNSWDVAAGLVIAKEAGFKVSNFTAGDWLKKGNPLLIAPNKIYNEIYPLIFNKHLVA